MQYYLLHQNGYKFTSNVQDLTRIQMTYLTKATEIQNQIRSDNLLEKNNFNFKPNQNQEQTLKDKVKQRREEAKNG